MRLVVSEKNIAARRIAEILAVGKPSADTVYTTPVYRFRRDGDDWVSIGLKGHIMKVDFPEQHEDADLKRWRLEALPTLTRAPVEKSPAEKGIIQSLKNLAKKADEVIVATDYDREGELIGSDARSVIREVNPDVPVQRVRFSAITAAEIEKAFSEPSEISDDLAQAGEARQDIDLVWGAVLTRYLTLSYQQAVRAAFGNVLSAGRVQTPTLKLIVDREREREAFEPETFWVVKAQFEVDGHEFSGTHSTERFSDESAARAALAACEGAASGIVVTTERSRRTVKPPAPFNTTALLAAAAQEGLAPARAMRVAESLYMNGLISYPRVDNTVYPQSLDLKAIVRALGAVSTYQEHVSRLLERDRLSATRGQKEATDHPPVHPTAPAELDRLKPEEWKLYDLVARRFLATLSDQAVLEGTKVVVDVAGEPFVSRGDVIVEPGFRAIYSYGSKKEERLPALAKDDEVVVAGVSLDERQTQPPSRYSQGRLIQEMERAGLGTKATRHDIIQTLYDRKYVNGDPLEPTCRGRAVVDALVKHAERITTPAMTSELEGEMDAIAGARASRADVVGHSQALLAEVIEALLPLSGDVGEVLRVAADEDATVGTCPNSGDTLRIRYSPKTKSYFVGCTGYPECGVTYPLPQRAKYEAVEDLCPVCGTPQVRVVKFKQRPRVMCLSTECPTKTGPDAGMSLGACPSGDGGRLQVTYSAVGSKFARCTNYEQCGKSYPLPQSGEIQITGDTCEPCGAPVVVVQTRRGPWRMCVDPECETKAFNGKATRVKRPAKSGAGRKRTAAKPKKPSAAREGSGGEASLPTT